MPTETKIVLGKVQSNGSIETTTPDGKRNVENWLDEGWSVRAVYPLGDGEKILLQLEREARASSAPLEHHAVPRVPHKLDR